MITMRTAFLTLIMALVYSGLNGVNGERPTKLNDTRIEQLITNADWTSITSARGVRGDVYALAADTEGSLYIGGEFIVAGDEIVNYITKWDGHRFTRLGDGLDRPVTALVASGTDVFMCAHSDYISEGLPGKILKWDGQSWTSLGDGVNGPVRDLLFHEGNLYAGGWFSEIDGQAANNIAVWDGTNWSPMGEGMDDRVEVLTLFEGEVHAGGYFSMAGNSAANGLARWDGTAWTGYPSFSEGSIVQSAVVFKEDLVVCGRIAIGSEAGESQIAKWDGVEWTRITENLVTFATAMAVVGDVLFVNSFVGPGESEEYWMGYWDGEEWFPTGQEFAYGVNRLTVFEGNLYAAGDAQDPAGFPTYRPAGIYHWNGSRWNTLGSGLDGTITATGVSGKTIYIAGDFSKVDNLAASRVAKWDGRQWSALGDGLASGSPQPGRIDSIAINGSEVYFGKSNIASSTGGNNAIRVDLWDGERWSILKEGTSNFNFTIAALVHSGTELYAGGDIGEYNHVAKWDGTSWSELGSGPGGTVNDLALLNGQLYAGGFGSMGVVRWNGSDWSSVGGEFNGTVSSLAVFDGDLYAAGAFTKIGDTDAKRIARWDGSRWAGLGDGPNFNVTDLAASGSALYVAGGFTKVGDLEARRIARWDGSSWAALGSGVGSFVTDLDVSSEYLIVGGSFYEAGGRAAPYLAVGLLGNPPVDVLSTGLMESQLTVQFRSLPGLSGWSARGGRDLLGFPDTLTQSLTITETGRGMYTAVIDLGAKFPENYFLQFVR